MRASSHRHPARYLERAREFVAQAPVTSIEPRLVGLWRRTLDALEHLVAHVQVSASPVIGQIDWITKKYALDTAGHQASAAARAQPRDPQLGRRETAVEVSWDRILVGRPIGGTVIRLDAYRDT